MFSANWPRRNSRPTRGKPRRALQKVTARQPPQREHCLVARSDLTERHEARLPARRRSRSLDCFPILSVAPDSSDQAVVQELQHLCVNGCCCRTPWLPPGAQTIDHGKV